MDADVAAAAAAAADVLVASGSAAPDDERVPVAVQSAAGATPLASGAPEQLLARAAADAGDWCSDDGFEFGSDAASDSSSWSSSDEEEQGVPLAVGALPEWLARQGTAGGSDVDDEEEDTCPRPPVATAPEELGPPLSSVDETEDIRAAGTVLSVVGCTVVVQAAPGEKPLDDGSIICTADRLPLGLVEETFGPVQAPLYAVRRCRATEAVPAVHLSSGQQVFFVVARSTFIEDVAKLHVKGYDASGKDDLELDEEEEFSDDEKEAEARLQRKHKRQEQADTKRHEQGKAAAGPAKEAPRAPVSRQPRQARVQHNAGSLPFQHGAGAALPPQFVFGQPGSWAPVMALGPGMPMGWAAAAMPAQMAYQQLPPGAWGGAAPMGYWPAPGVPYWGGMPPQPPPQPPPQ